MRTAVVGLVLLVSPAQAASWDARDCDYVQVFFEACARGPQDLPYIGQVCMGKAFQSDTIRRAEFEKRHPNFRLRYLERVCKQVCENELATEAAIRQFCRRNRAYRG